MRIGEVNAHRTCFQPGLNIRIEKMCIKTWDGNAPTHTHSLTHTLYTTSHHAIVLVQSQICTFPLSRKWSYRDLAETVLPPAGEVFPAGV